MNNSSTSSYSSPSITGGFSTYALTVSFVVLILIVTITLASYYCSHSLDEPSTTRTTRRTSQDSFTIELGLDESTIRSYPKLLYSQAKRDHLSSVASCSCSICLGDYNDSDMLRLLPNCGHTFHYQCVDPWLRLHPTCPICRNSPAPTPLSTPLAEVAPLAAHGRF